MPPAPGPLPTFWFDWHNDLLGIGENDDDGRSQQLAFSGQGFGNLIYTVDQSTLTARGPSEDAADPGLEGRTDQFTLAGGYALWHDEADWPGNRAESDRESLQWRLLAFGLALRHHGRLDGDLSAEQAQNNWHRYLDVPQVELPYTETEETSLAAWMSGSYTRAWALGGRYAAGLWLIGQGYASFEQQEACLGVHAVCGQRSVQVWAGLRQELRAGYDDDLVQEAVKAQEEGSWACAGVQLGNTVLVETGYQFDDEWGYGRVGLAVDLDWQTEPGAELPPSAEPLPLVPTPAQRTGWKTLVPDVLDFGTQLPDFAAVLGMRWLPQAWGWRWARLSPLLDGRLGQAGGELDGEDRFHQRQVTGGLMAEFFPFRNDPHLRHTWFSAALSYGWRQEVLANGDRHPISGTQADGSVLLVDVGVIIAPLPRGLGFSLGYSHWWPSATAELEYRGSSVEYLQEQGSPRLLLSWSW